MDIREEAGLEPLNDVARLEGPQGSDTTGGKRKFAATANKLDFAQRAVIDFQRKTKCRLFNWL